MSQYTPMSVSGAVETLASNGSISQLIGAALARNDRLVQLPNMMCGFEDPVLASILIDASGSMVTFRDAIIEGQHMILSLLRNSVKCRLNALYVEQYLVGDDSTLLHPFELLDAGKNDSVIALGHENYTPKGRTSLYITINMMLQDIVAGIAYAQNHGLKATSRLIVVTDGVDTEAEIDVGHINAIVKELRSRGHLSKTLIVGISSREFSPETIYEIKDRMGFDIAIVSSQSPIEIRRSFRLATEAITRVQS